MRGCRLSWQKLLGGQGARQHHRSQCHITRQRCTPRRRIWKVAWYIMRPVISPDRPTIECPIFNGNSVILTPSLAEDCEFGRWFRYKPANDRLVKSFCQVLDLKYNRKTYLPGMLRILQQLQRGELSIFDFKVAVCPHRQCTKTILKIDGGHYCTALEERWTNHYIAASRLIHANGILDDHRVRPFTPHNYDLPNF